MSKEQIKAVMKLVPDLTDFGIGIYEDGRGLSPEEKAEAFLSCKADLLNSTEAFQKAVEWVSRINKAKSFNQKRSSYGLKHLAEKHIGYITNGVFIAAAIHSGFDHKIQKNNPNVYFNMSESSIKEIENS